MECLLFKQRQANGRAIGFDDEVIYEGKAQPVEVSLALIDGFESDGKLVRENNKLLNKLNG